LTEEVRKELDVTERIPKDLGEAFDVLEGDSEIFDKALGEK
jgi:glutamine synthetase